MKAGLKFTLALALAALAVMACRSLAITIYTVDGNGLEPELHRGDRVLVNRWSYGLRTGTPGSLFRYGRILRRPIQKGDIVAFNHPDPDTGGVLVCRCAALPGDTVSAGGERYVVPGLATCADQDYYWMEAIGKNNPTDSRTLGFIAEQHIIGRVVTVLFNHTPEKPFYSALTDMLKQ